MAERRKTDTPAGESKPTRLQLALFSFPSLPHAFIALPLNIVIPAYYAAHTAVTLLQIASVTTASRILDAVLDPTIGYLSDRTKSRLGRRKPWVLAAAIVCSIAIYFLFQPPPKADFVYYGVWSFLLYFGFTLFEIPRGAWTAEVTRDYHQRARLNTYVAIFNVVGSLVFWLMPLALSRLTGTMAITGATLSGIAWLYVALMPVGVILAVLFVSSGIQTQEKLSTVRQMLQSFGRNKPLWNYYGAISAWGLGQGAYLSVILIFLSDYLQMAQYFPVLMIAFFIVQAVTMPLWQWIVTRHGRHRVWAVTMTLDALSRPLILLLAPGAGMVPLLAIGALGAFLNAPANFCPTAILGDVADYDLMKSGMNKTGNLYAFNTLLIKATMALGAGFAFLMLDMFHYKVGHSNGAHANLGLLLCYLVFPALLYFIASAIAWFFPIDAARHSVIRRRIERRVVVEPLLGTPVP
ncbi:MAG: MFS transporter [Rhizomicrobium sp.]